jgi:glycosyltransferase involved in cell wall biosynthesis
MYPLDQEGLCMRRIQMNAPTRVLVSVVIPTHNRPHLLVDALDSVRAQTFRDYEIIVVSNGETDEMSELSGLAASRARARYIRVIDGNLSSARNIGVTHSVGELIAFLDDDDIWHREKLEKQISRFKSRPECGMVSCDYMEDLGSSNKHLSQPRFMDEHSQVHDSNHRIWWAIPSCVMIKRKAFTSVGGFDPEMKAVEDIELWRRVSWDHKIHQMTETLVIKRSSHKNMTSNVKNMHWYTAKFIIKMHRDTPKQFRETIPSIADTVPLLAVFLMPDPIIRILRKIRPRTRIKNFLKWMENVKVKRQLLRPTPASRRRLGSRLPHRLWTR